MQVICLACGHKVELGEAYEDYAGQVKCVACGAILEIVTNAGALRSVALARQVARAPATPAGDVSA